MNDATPRQYRGSLIERAAARYDLSPRAWSAPASGSFAPIPNPGVRAAATPRQTVTVDRELLTERGMLVPGAAVTALAEEFRLVKRQLLANARTLATSDAEKARMVLISSAKPNDGKTFCAVNLALSLAAERDLEILLVDADFAKPGVLKALGATHDGPGLLDALADPALDVESCIVATDVPHLTLLPAGAHSHSDTELVASDRARAILSRLASANPRRIVIFDSAPVLAASPAPVLASHVGQTLVIVRADRTSEADLRSTVGLLDGCENIQLLLNAVAFQPGGKRFGDYYGQELEQ